MGAYYVMFGMGAATPLNAALRPKPAFGAVRKVLAGGWGRSDSHESGPVRARRTAGLPGE